MESQGISLIAHGDKDHSVYWNMYRKSTMAFCTSLINKNKGFDGVLKMFLPL